MPKTELFDNWTRILSAEIGTFGFWHSTVLDLKRLTFSYLILVLLNIWSLSTGSVIQTVTWESSAVGQVKELFWMDNRRLAVAFQLLKVIVVNYFLYKANLEKIELLHQLSFTENFFNQKNFSYKKEPFQQAHFWIFINICSVRIFYQ